MPTLTQIYHQIGMKPRNVQWGWSAQDRGQRRVVLQLWAHGFRKEADGHRYYERTAADATQHEIILAGAGRDVDRLLGMKGLFEDLAYARDEGIAIEVILSRCANADEVRTKGAVPRAESFEYQTRWRVRVETLDVDARTFRLCVVPWRNSDSGAAPTSPRG
jgi:hypothetical protein